MDPLTTIATVVVLLLQFATVIWAVSQFKATLDNLTNAVNKLTATAEKFDDRLDDHEVRISLLDQRVRTL